MQAISEGFLPDEWNRTFGAFRRLIEHLADMQTMLTECGELTSENSDVTYIREQVKEEVATLAFMTREAETHWKALGVSVASAAGRLNLNRPADDVAWCSSVLNAAWNLHNGLSRELSGSDSEVCVQRLPLHLGRIPNDIQSWKDRIAAELRAGVLCESDKPKQNTVPTQTVERFESEVLCKSYYPGKLARRIGCDSGTLSTYAVEHAKLTPRGVGERDKPYSPDEVKKICVAFLDKSKLSRHQQAAKEILNGG